MLDEKYSLRDGRIYLTGVQALARLALEQRRRDVQAGLNTAGFISGYRGSPLGTLDQQLWKAKQHLQGHEIRFQPGLNEELAATAVWGSQQTNLFEGARYDGVFSMWYGKAPGVDRAGDALRHGASAGSSRHGGVLVLAGDDHNCKSASLPSQSEYAAVHAMMPVLNPAGLDDLLDYGLLGWAMSRFSGCWVMLKCLIDTMDVSASIDVSSRRPRIVIPEDFGLPLGGLNIRWPDPPLEQERRLIEQRLPAARAFALSNGLNRVVLEGGARPRLGIVTTGKSYLDVRQALESLGITPERAGALGVSLYKVGMSWPLETDGARRFADGLEQLIVVEEKRDLIEQQLARALYALPDGRRPRLLGKTDESGAPLFGAAGELSTRVIAATLLARLRQMHPDDDGLARAAARETDCGPTTMPGAVLAKRVPYFCSGCPHNTSTNVPEGSRALAGIGCHYMAQWMDRRTETFTQMGGEGASWIGQAPFTDTPHVFVNLGDGTYAHSGSLAIRAAVAAGVTITYKLLYNDAVAMTGGQPAEGGFTPSQIVAQLRAEGVAAIRVLAEDPGRYPPGSLPKDVPLLPREELESVQREMREIRGVSVLLYDQTCAAEKRRRRKHGIEPEPAGRAFINEAVCEGCGDCGVQSNCVSILPVETALGRKRRIDQASCNKDFSCVKGFCPSFVTVVGGSVRKVAAERRSLPDLPDPELPVLDRPFDILIAGVGGTGIVTIGALIGMAAHIEGKGVSVLDMIGLSQKGGPVLSQVRLAALPSGILATRIPHRGARLLLGGDLLVAAGSDALAMLDPDRGVAVINSHELMPAEFTRDADMVFPAAQMFENISRACGGGVHRIDATATATSALGEAAMANTFLLGFAWQKGQIPLSRASLAKAIALNGVAVDDNLHAFDLGRLAASEAEAPSAPAESVRPETLSEIVADRAAHLTAYQDGAYADRYRRLVSEVEAAERVRTPDAGGLAEAVAVAYAKLLAIKDEYEVARLYSDGAFKRALAAQFEGDFQLVYHLAPPTFAKRDPLTGHLRKSKFGAWIGFAFPLLARLKGLRGGPLDIFGMTAERRMERRLVADYEALIGEVLQTLAPENHDVAVALAQTPFKVRGFGHVKEAAADRVATETAVLLERFRRIEAGERALDGAIAERG